MLKLSLISEAEVFKFIGGSISDNTDSNFIISFRSKGFGDSEVKVGVIGGCIVELPFFDLWAKTQLLAKVVGRLISVVEKIEFWEKVRDIVLHGEVLSGELTFEEGSLNDSFT